jgi:hypothetical protein
VLFHSGSPSVVETTNFGIELNLSANSPSRCGQAPAKLSYQLSLDKTEIDSRSHRTTVDMQVVLGVRGERSLDEGRDACPGSESARRWRGAPIVSVAVPFG